MSAKKKRQDAFKAKEKKQKIIAGVGGVLLVGLLAFQVPRVMKMMHPAGAASAAATTTSTSTSTSPTPSSQTPTTDGGSVAGSAGLITSSVSGATEGQLTSFSRFESKDPFQQQVDDSPSAATAPEPAAGSASSAGGTSRSTASGGSPQASSSAGSGTQPAPSGGTQPAPGGAVISVNGALMSVVTGSDFPEASPLFHLVSVTATTAKISIAGGSYSNGAASVTLHVNRPVTLMNTADGTRYRLILKPQGTPVPATAAATSTAPASTTPSP